MSVLEEVAALRADLEKVHREKETEKREKEATQAELDRVQLENEASDAENREYGMRFRRERSLGTSFGERGGGGSADRRGAAASPMGPMWTRGVSTGSGLGQSLPCMSLGAQYQNSPWNVLLIYISPGRDVLIFL